MVDSLGYRMKFGVIAPSTNTSVQPEYEAMTPHGVTNHFSRVIIPDTTVTDDESFMIMLDNIRGACDPAIDAIMSSSPDHVIMGMSAETFWDGLDGSKRLQEKMEQRAGVGVTLGSDACQAALNTYGGLKRIAVLTPYMPVGDEQVRKFFTDCGYEVAALKGLRCKSPVLIAHVGEKELRDAIIELNTAKVDAIVQCGTNLAMARLAAMAEFWLDKPVIAINTATYWYALRQNGMDDKIYGFGALLEKY